MFEHREMNKEYFQALTDKFRSPHWPVSNGDWSLRHQISNIE